MFCQEPSEEAKKERKYSFSFGPLAGFVHGQSFEYVYQAGDSGELLSELVWDMKPVFYLGARFDFSRSDIMSDYGFFSSLQFKAASPADSGIMEDRDWDWNMSQNKSLTNYSRHTNKTLKFFWFDICAGASFPIADLFYIKPLLAFSWMHFSFSASDGYKSYMSENWNIYTFRGEVITYRQNWFLVSPGVSIGAQIGSLLQFELSFKYTPLTYCAAVDNHLDPRKTIEYFDYTGWGNFVEPSGAVSLKLDKADITLEFACRKIGRTVGNTYVNSFQVSNKSGAALSLIDASIIFKIII